MFSWTAADAYAIHAVNLVDEIAGITLVLGSYSQITKHLVTFTISSHLLKGIGRYNYHILCQLRMTGLIKQDI